MSVNLFKKLEIANQGYKIVLHLILIRVTFHKLILIDFFFLLNKN